jgi:hypothetical protein
MRSFRPNAGAADFVPGTKQSSGGRGSIRPALALGTMLAVGLAAPPQAHAGLAANGAARAAPVAFGVGAPGMKMPDPRSPQSGLGVIFVQARSEFAVDDIVGEPGGSIPIGIKMPPFQPTDYLVLSFRGLPKGFSLSSGFRTAEAWLVSAHEAKTLRLDPPAGYTGNFPLYVQLIRGQDVEPLAQTVRVSVEPQRSAQQSEATLQETLSSIPAALDVDRDTASDAHPATLSVTKKAMQIDPEKERDLMRMARAMLDQNDIAAARLIYARIAREGSAQGALTLAQTYDVAFLSRYDVSGLGPNMEKAKYWYGIAASLGSTDASGRLLALEGASRP